MQNLPKDFQLKNIERLEEFNFIEKCVNIISSEIGNVSAKDDRFGIFFDNPDKNISLSELITKKTFAEITDLTAQSYVDKNVAVCWSGGIDSTLIVCALYKNNIKFKVTVMHNRCKFENPDMYDWVIKNCDIIALDERTSFNNLYDHVKNGGTVVSGDPADQLFPSILYNLLPGISPQKNLYSRTNGYSDYLELFSQEYSDEIFYNNIEYTILSCNIKKLNSEFVYPKCFEVDVINFISLRLQKNNIDFKHYYQLKWLTKFIFKYNSNKQRLLRIINSSFKNSNRTEVDFVQYDFFDTWDYQAWAWTNLDRNFELYSKTALTYKWEAKEYIRDVTGLESQLNLIKVPSL
jgi:hypothetical protein